MARLWVGSTPHSDEPLLSLLLRIEGEHFLRRYQALFVQALFVPL